MGNVTYLANLALDEVKVRNAVSMSTSIDKICK
jgi:hypothetical protein